MKSHKPAVRKRPALVTFLAVGVLIYTGFYWMRFYQASFAQREFLEGLPLPFSLIYFQITGFVFGLGGVLCFLGLWRGSSWAPSVTKILALISAAAFWADRILLAKPDPGLGNWPFVLVVTLFLLGYVFLIFRNENVEYYFLPVIKTPGIERV